MGIAPCNFSAPLVGEVTHLGLSDLGAEPAGQLKLETDSLHRLRLWRSQLSP